MAVLFHQNMRIFGGGAPARNAAYNGPGPGPGGAFAAIAAAVAGVGPVAVAGFTEITNNGASVAALTASCASLGLAWGGNVVCGRTALAHGPEYIGIGIHPTYALVTVGHILLQANGGGGGITLIHRRAAGFGGGLPLPAAATRDFRGVVYVVVTVPGGGPNIAVGFLHNLYTFEAQRVLVAGQIPQMLAMMGAAASGLGAVAVGARYIGGDFNVAMISPRGTVRQGRAWGYSAGLAAVPVGAVAGGTTWSGSLYDYWHSDINPAGPAPAGLIVPVPAAHNNTLNAGPGIAGTMSDHGGVSLRII